MPYRTQLALLIKEANLNVSKLARESGISRQTIYAWIAAESEESALPDYHASTETQLRLVIERYIGRRVEIFITDNSSR